MGKIYDLDVQYCQAIERVSSILQKNLVLKHKTTNHTSIMTIIH